jgi:2-iminobutanoate/2-iminopropanoate deaminase
MERGANGRRIERVETRTAPIPAGHYSQALIHEGIIYVAGQLPIDPATGVRQLGSIEAQTEQVLRNLAAIVEAAGSDLSRVLRTTVYVADITLWERVNAVYQQVFGSHRPARTVVPVPTLHHGFLIEIDAIAACRPPLG